MEGQFSVTIGQKPVGKVLVVRKGLYYHFSCSCDLSGEIIYRLMVSSGAARENLGILVPKEGGFGLDTKLPVKRIGEGALSFWLMPKQGDRTGTFVPISPEEPFAYISRLKESFFVLQNGQPGISIVQKQEH